MKKTLIIVTLLSIFLFAKAQIKVDTLGNVLIGSTGVTPYQLQVSGNNKQYSLLLAGGQNQLCLQNSGQNSNVRRGIYILNIGDSVDTYGINIMTSSSFHTGKSYGIKSLGSRSRTLSCGVMGGLYGHYAPSSAGIIGSSSMTTQITQSQYSGIYAGFFDGDVRVTGALYANVLTPTQSSINQSNSSERSVLAVNGETDPSNEGVSCKLRKVQLLMIRNYIEHLSSDTIDIESLESDDYKTLMEKLDNGETLTPDEIERFDKEQAKIEKALVGTEVPHTRMASTRYGLDADQLRRVYPELVYEDQNGNVSINYIEMVPLLVQSINELQERIDNLEQDNSNLRAELSGDETSVKSRDGANDIENTETDILSISQNDPNPFSERTAISLNIPESVTTAAVFFYDMSGKQIDKRIITERGNTQISVTSADFTEGMYLYSLIADGKVVATRKMILTK